MFRDSRAGLVGCLSALLILSGPALPGSANEPAPGPEGYPSAYSVDMHIIKDGKTMVMKRAVDGAKSRMDMTADGNEVAMIMLDDERRTMITLMPEQKKAMKQSLAAAEEMANKMSSEEEAAAAPEGKIESLGKETIDGKEADKYRVTYEEGSGLMWIDAKTHLPLRMESEGTRVDFKNYQFGPQPAELFEVPKGYEVMDLDQMMASMPKGMGGMMGSMTGGMMGGAMGSSMGGMLGGPLGAMAGQFVGDEIGQNVGGAPSGK